MIRGLGLYLLVASLGCAAHKPSAPPDVAGLPAPTASTAPQADPAAWWETLGDSRLTETVRTVLKQNLDLKALDQQVIQQQAVARMRRAGLLPQLNLGVSTNFQPGQVIDIKLPDIPGFEREPQPENPYALSLTSQVNLAYEADLFGRLRHGQEAAVADALAAQADRQALALVLAAQTTELYLGAVELRAQLRRLADTLALQNRQLALLRGRHERGLSGLLAVQQQEQLMATTQAQVPLLEGQLKITALRLAALLGQTEAKAEYLGGRVDFPALRALPEQGIPSALIMRRPDVAAALARLRSADHRLGEALAARYPSLRLQASGGLGIAPNSPTGVDLEDLGGAVGDDLANIFENPGDQMAWSLGGSLSLPLFTGGRVKGQISAAGAGREAMALRYRKVVVDALTETFRALAAEASQTLYIQRLEIQQSKVRATRDLALRRYQEGLASYDSYLQAELSLSQVEASLIGAKRQRVSHRVALLRAVAGPLNSGEIPK